ncbi:hypothetical protein Mgra_00000965 [Meloidogyne graminicola]|uniref:TNFR-Cys domain-containing protein n=1 Tax=Meloidogyne graminicola TaxID=189291 RepID=A0A8T0A227_9BILA|nr:hypothetical protein Mgra_00000965 [Meloidogyne graminicola]
MYLLSIKIILLFIIQLKITKSLYSPSSSFIVIENEDEIDNSKLNSFSSSISTSEEEEDSLENENGKNSLENVENWKSFKFCIEGEFLSNKGNCQQCTICEGNYFEKKPCQSNQDTQCELCINVWKDIENMGDFLTKCTKIDNFRNKFYQKMNEIKNEQKSEGFWKKNLPKIFFPSESSTYLFNFIGIKDNNNNLWKIELIIKIIFYLLLIILILSIIRFIYLKKSFKKYQTIQIKNPPILEEFQEKDIIRAAENIYQKLGKKNYEKLQEEFI